MALTIVVVANVSIIVIADTFLRSNRRHFDLHVETQLDNKGLSTSGSIQQHSLSRISSY
jgi:hypothetical protein